MRRASGDRYGPSKLVPAGGCQRWRQHRHSWRTPADGGFDPTRYEVDRIEEASAKGFVVQHHYSASYPAASHRFGLFEQRDGLRHLVGAAVFGIPASRAVLTNTFPGLEAYVESVELSRFVLVDEVPANGESWFLARCHSDLARAGVRGVVAFSDPVPRAVSGRTVLVGHWGTIYQASNATFCGRSTPRTLVLLPDGTVLSDRAAQKVRSADRGHRYVTERLVGLGAGVPEPGTDPSAWLAEALAQVGATRLRHPGCLRYAFRLGTSARLRRGVELGLPSGPYPKAQRPS